MARLLGDEAQHDEAQIALVEDAAAPAAAHVREAALAMAAEATRRGHGGGRGRNGVWRTSEKTLFGCR